MTSNSVCSRKKIFLLKDVCIMYDFAFVLIQLLKEVRIQGRCNPHHGRAWLSTDSFSSG